MRGKTQGRVGERIKQILGHLLEFEVRDPRLEGTTVVDVEIDRELMYATVYVTSLRGEEARVEVMEGLDDAMGFLRRELGSRIRLRHVPELRFRWDETTSYAARIEALLDSLDIPDEEDKVSGSGDTADNIS